MAEDPLHRPLIWVLKGLRAGDTAQAMELALQLGGRVEGKQLIFNASHMLPNWLAGARVSHLAPEARMMLRPPWPDLVVATGKRTAAVSVWIKRQSGGRTRIVQLGRPRMALSHFDLVVSTSQYSLPQRPNVIQLPLPFASPKTVAEPELQVFAKLWATLPKPWIVGVIGGQKFPQRLSSQEIAGFGRAVEGVAKVRGGSVLLIDSPRSPSGALAQAAAEVSAPHWVFRRGVDVNPYQAAMALGDAFIVTSDSVSMVSEMLRTGKPTSVYRLPVSALVPRWSSQHGLGASLAAAGILHPPRDVDGFMNNLERDGWLVKIGETRANTLAKAFGSAHQTVVARIKSLLAASS